MKLIIEAGQLPRELVPPELCPNPADHANVCPDPAAHEPQAPPPPADFWIPDAKYPANEPYNNAQVRTLPAWKTEWGTYPTTTGDNHRWVYERLSLPSKRGTTLEIMRWAQDKWFPEYADTAHPLYDLTYALGWKETAHNFAGEGDFQQLNADINFQKWGRKWGHHYQSYGYFQVKMFYNPGSFPFTRFAAGFHADYAWGILRMSFEGRNWAPQNTKDSIWACVGAHMYGAHLSKTELEQSDYVSQVKSILASKPWA